MTLDEAIRHCREQARGLRNRGEVLAAMSQDDTDCALCAAEHEQLAKWLEELQQRREAEQVEVPTEMTEAAKRYLRDRKWYLKEAEFSLESARKRAEQEGQHVLELEVQISACKHSIAEIEAWLRAAGEEVQE